MSDSSVCPNGREICHTILTEVAVTNGEDPESLTPPLYEVIDPDALENLFREHERRPGFPLLVFSYAGCRITVHGPEEVTVERIRELPDTEK